MEKLAVYGIVFLIAAVVVVGLLFAYGRSGPIGSQTGISQQGSSTIAQGNVSDPLFSGEPYYPYSYQIYPGSLSPQAKAAMDGYNMTAVQVPGGSENITLSTQGRGGTLTLGASQKLYIVETAFGDDAPGYEGSVSDDGFVVVDQNGHTVGSFGI